MPKYDSYSQFKLFISENTKVASKLIPGCFYTFDYAYETDRTNKSYKKIEKMSYYDKEPVTFIFNYYKSKNGKITVEGLNLHHMPVKARMFLIQTFKRLSPSSFKNGTRVTTSPKMLKQMILKLHIKSKYVFRQYDIYKIKRLRKISFNDIDEIIKYIPETFESRQYQEVAVAYRLYNPYNKKQ